MTFEESALKNSMRTSMAGCTAAVPIRWRTPCPELQPQPTENM